MDENNPVVFDISSDEETAMEEPISNDYSWISRFLADDSDEVVVVGEVKSKSSKPAVNNDDDDDDCVVLDGDPDKPVESVDDEESEGDELLIVGQKGQIACRDFPHLRHHCAKFPFSSTAHKLHCSRCHCYVCDKLAPCEHWGTGVYSNDHCHATDKEASWKSQRESFRLQKDAPLLLPKVLDAALSKALPPLNQAPPLDAIRLPSNSTAQTQVCRSAVVRPCSSDTRFGVPNIISHSRSRHPGSVNRGVFQTQSVSQQSQFLRARSNIIRKDRGHNASSIGMYKRPGIAGGAFTTNQPVYGAPNQGRVSHVMQSARVPVPQATSNDRIQIGSVPSMNKDSCAYQNTFETCATSVIASTVTSQPHMYNQPFPDPQAFSQLMTQQPIYSQPIPEPQVYGQPLPAPQGYGEPIPEPQLYSQPFPAAQVLDQAISLPLEHTQAICQSNDGQNVNQLGNQIPRQGSCIPDFEWVNNISPQSNPQLPADNCQLNTTGSTDELLPSHNGSDKFHCNDFEFANWFAENDAVDVVSGGYSPSNLLVVSPEPANFDAGMLLFDFETSWNGLAQV